MTGAPTSGHTSRYSPENSEHHADGRLVSRVVARNAPPLLAALAPWLADLGGTVLEIGSGTGQHGAQFALACPHLTWQCSDPDAGHRASAQAWARHLGVAAPSPLDIDAAQDWADTPEVRTLTPVSAVAAFNVIHIAPISVLHGILSGAARVLTPGGLVILYGPFTEPGVPDGPGNLQFDANLRAENPEWGLRDIAQIRALGVARGLSFAALLAMPANNRILILRRDSTGG